MKAAEWIDRVKTARGWESDYRVAKELGLSRSAVSLYRSKASTMDDESAVKVAAALGEKPEIVLLDQTMERSQSEAARSALGDLLKRLGGVAAGLVVAVGVVSGPSQAEARTAYPAAPSSQSGCILCKETRRPKRRLRSAFEAIRDTLTGNTLVFA